MKIRSTPAIFAAARMEASTFPSAFGGVVMTSMEQPASFAGTQFISRDDGYAAVPFGTYSPTRSMGVTFWPRTTPLGRVITKPGRI